MKLSKENYLKARDFILTNVRMIERRLFQFYFENDNSEGVFHAVYAYRNSDGGFGHGMEPDTASPESQPLFSIMALETLDEVGCLNATLIKSDFLPYFKSVTTEKGGIPWMLQPKSEYPCAEHFKTVKEWAALSTTAPLLGVLEKYKNRHSLDAKSNRICLARNRTHSRQTRFLSSLCTKTLAISSIH